MLAGMTPEDVATAKCLLRFEISAYGQKDVYGYMQRALAMIESMQLERAALGRDEPPPAPPATLDDFLHHAVAAAISSSRCTWFDSCILDLVTGASVRLMMDSAAAYHLLLTYPGVPPVRIYGMPGTGIPDWEKFAKIVTAFVSVRA